MRNDTILIGATALVIGILLIAANIPAAPDEFVDDYPTGYGAVGWWNFEEGTGTTTFDQSPYGNDGAGYTPGTLVGGLAGYDQRVKFTVNSADVDEAQTNFTVLIALGSSVGENNEDVTFIFDEVGANWKKIAVTTSDGLTQCSVEKDKWDFANEQAWLFFKAPSISNTSDTDFYLYYDVDVADNDAYVGDSDDAVTHNVWDDDYLLVTHMRDDPDTSHVRDSTQYANDGTKKGAGEPAVTTAGMIDDAQDFDAVNDYITMPDVASLEFTGDFLISAWVNFDTLDAADAQQSIYVGERTYSTVLGQRKDESKIQLAVYNATGISEMYVKADDTHVTVGSYNNIVGVFDQDFNATHSKGYVYIDGVERASLIKGTVTIRHGAALNFIGDIDAAGYSLDGTIDEVHVSNTTRTPAWIETSYESGRDHFVDFGSVEAGVPTPTIYWTSGKYGEAINFTDTYVTVGDVSTSLRTIWFWINLNSTSEPILQLKAGVYINVTDGVLSATGFAGTVTFYVDGVETTTITSGEWHHVAFVSDTNEDCSALTLGLAGGYYLTGKLDQLRAFTVSKTAAEVGVQYLDPTGGMYSGSVIVSDDFRILGTDLATDFSVVDGNVTISDAIVFDTGDFIVYDAGNNRYLFYIGDAVVGFVNATGFYDGPP